MFDIESIPTIQVDTSLIICPGDSILFQTEYLDAGHHSLFFEVDSLCLNYKIQITEQEQLYSDTILYLCPRDFIILNEELFIKPGTYQQILETAFGCDSLVNVEIIPLEESYELVELSLCPGDILELNGIVYNQPGEYEQTLVATNGCDSLVDIRIAREELSFSDLDLELCQGDLIELNGVQYSQGGIYQQVLVNSVGCDSILNIDIVELDTNIIRLDFAICSGEKVFIMDSLLNSPGSYEIQGFDKRGCLVTWFVNITERDDCETCIEGVEFYRKTFLSFEIEARGGGFYDATFLADNKAVMQDILDVEGLSWFISGYATHSYLLQKNLSTENITTLCKKAESAGKQSFFNYYNSHLRDEIGLSSTEILRLRESSDDILQEVLNLRQNLRYRKESF